MKKPIPFSNRLILDKDVATIELWLGGWQVWVDDKQVDFKPSTKVEQAGVSGVTVLSSMNDRIRIHAERAGQVVELRIPKLERFGVHRLTSYRHEPKNGKMSVLRWHYEHTLKA